MELAGKDTKTTIINKLYPFVREMSIMSERYGKSEVGKVQQRFAAHRHYRPVNFETKQ